VVAGSRNLLIGFGLFGPLEGLLEPAFAILKNRFTTCFDCIIYYFSLLGD
jgi:hypothetical protein